MRKILLIMSALLGLLAIPALAQDADLSPEAVQFLEELRPQSGQIAIPAANATLDLGDAYLFYGPDDSRRILVEAWGNPPQAADGVLGLIMPVGTTPLSDAWGAVVTFEATGYVTDDDVTDADYDALMEEMQEGSVASNEERRAAGYPGVELIGWAQSPQYDPSGHSVIWARELAFDGEEVHSLNYDMRTLGRSGVLSINLVASMPQLAEVRLAANELASLAAFDPGARYEDFDSSTDDMAGYGLAGLVAGGAGLAAAKKVGVLALLIKFIKPILLGLFVLFAAFAGRIKRLFGMTPADPGEEDWQAYEEPEPEADAMAEKPAEAADDSSDNRSG